MELMSRTWWMMVLRGVAAILFGLMVFLWPGLALNVLLLMFAAYALVDGLLALGTAWRNRAIDHANWIAPLLEGLAGLIVAGLTLLAPGITAVTLLYIIAVWAIVTGVFEMYAAYHYRKTMQNEIWMGLSGLASIIFGVLLIAFPATGALAVLWMIGGYALIFGALLIMLGLRLRQHQNEGTARVYSRTSSPQAM